MTSPILSELLQQTTALRALARELVGDARADDIVQEAAIQTMTAPPERPGPAGGWLATVVRRLASKDRRAERIRRRHEAEAARAEVAPAGRSAEDADSLRRLTEIVTSLPEPYRGTILARYLRERTPSEIAAATGTPVRTVKTRLQRGLVLLRQRLDGSGEDWRTPMIAAFALDPTAAARPNLIPTSMKLAFFAAVLLPIAFVTWDGLLKSARATGETTSARRDAPAPSDSRATIDHGAAVGDESATTRAENPAGRGPAIPAPERAPGEPADTDASRASLTPEAIPVATVDSPPNATAAPPTDRPFMRFDAVGPAAFRAAFGPTNIGGLIASEEGERLWRPLLAPAEHIWRTWDGRGEEFEAARRRVLDYAGRIRVLWMLEPGEDGRDHVSGVFALHGDGSTDLGALGGDLSHAMLGFMTGEPTEQNVGQHALRMLGDAGSEIVTIPTVIDGRLVAFFGEAVELDQTVPRGLRALAAVGATPAAPLSLHIDLAQLRELSDVRDDPAVRKLLGLDSMRSFEATVRPVGVHAQLEFEVVFDDGERGVMAGIMPSVDTLPDLFGRIPAEATPWLTVPFRPDVIFRAIVASEASRHEGGLEAVRQEIRQEVGFDIDTELLDHLSGEVMVLGDLWQDDDPELFQSGGDPPLGACVAFSVRDATAFRRGFDKLLDQMKGAVHRHETREIDGVEITRLGSAFLTGVHMAVGQGLFAVAFGDEGVAQLEALVTARPAGNARSLPPAVQRVQHLAPAGWNGVGLADLSALFGGQVTLVLEMLEDSLPQQIGFDLSLDETQDRLDLLLPLVLEHRLEDLVTMTGYDDGRWRLRFVW